MRRAAAVISLVCTAAPAFAGGSQDTAAGPGADGAPPPADVDADQVAHLVSHDAAAGRAYVGPTALVEAPGELTFDLRQIVAPFGTMGFAYGVTDRVEAAVGLGWIDDLPDYEIGLAPSASVKVEALRARWGALAVQAGVVHAPGDSGVIAGGFAPYANLIGSVCASDRGCAILLSAYVGAVRTPNGSFGHELIPLYGGGSILAGNDHMKLLLEVDAAPDQLGPGLEETGVGGVRFLWERVSLDVGGALLSTSASSKLERTFVLGISFK